MSYEPAMFGPAPVLLAPASSPRGTVLLLHGLGADALANATELHLLRRAGYHAVGVDAPCHGRRHDPERDHRWSTDRDNELIRLVLAGGGELPDLIDAAEGAGLPAPFGIVGISLGAYSAWLGLAREPRVQAAALLLGSPELDHEDSAHLRPDAFAGRSILAVQAEHDEVVPMEPTRELIGRLDPSRAAMRVIEGSAHAVPESDWWVTWGRVLEWFDQSL